MPENDGPTREQADRGITRIENEILKQLTLLGWFELIEIKAMKGEARRC